MQTPEENISNNCRSSICPVPEDQIPAEEFQELCKSWFFTWPTKHRYTLYKSLIISWIITFPLFFLISSGSHTLRSDIIQLTLISAVSSLTLPITLLLRQYLGWNYVYHRLLSSKIEYEETGWYDGQTWPKPTNWQEKDLIIAQYELKPVLDLLKETQMISILILSTGILICISL